MNEKNKKFIPLILIILFIICMVTGIIISKNYLKEVGDINEVIKDDNPKLEIDSNDQEETLDNEEVSNEDKETNDNQEIQVDNDNSINEETNNTIDNDSSNNTNNTTNNNQNNSNTNQSNNSKPNNSSKPNNNSSSNKPSTPSKPSSDSNQNTQEDNTTNNNNNSNSNNNNSNNEVEIIPPTQEELNNSYRNSIYSTYGVKVTYGNEMGDYLVGYYSPTKMTDTTEINEYLGRIENELKKYPSRFFKEIRDYGMPVTIYLVKDIPGSDIAGLTNSQFYDNIVISIKAGLLFEKTLNHELMHYIDAYLNAKLYPESVETAWNLLNPVGFSYGMFDTNYDYFPTQNNNAYFFSNYSQTNYKEDRATLFEDIMTRAYKRPCYTNGYPLYSKIKLLAEQIDSGFETVNSSTIEYWEKYL
jgi:hypothetical protein